MNGQTIHAREEAARQELEANNYAFKKFETPEGTRYATWIISNKFDFYDPNEALTIDEVEEIIRDVVRKDGTCCICGKPYTDGGRNPEPIKSTGRCCPTCDANIVLPERMKRFQNQAS